MASMNKRSLTEIPAAEESAPAVADAAASDPARLGWMVGSPPPADRTLRFDDGSYFRFPAMRWSVSNFRQLMPTVSVSRGLEAPSPLERELRADIDAVQFTPLGATEPMTWQRRWRPTIPTASWCCTRGALSMSVTLAC